MLPVNLHLVDGERLAGIEGTNRWVGDESMRPNLQSTSVAVNPAVALKGRADHDCLAANRDGAADGRVLRPTRVGGVVTVTRSAIAFGTWPTSS